MGASHFRVNAFGTAFGCIAVMMLSLGKRMHNGMARLNFYFCDHQIYSRIVQILKRTK